MNAAHDPTAEDNIAAELITLLHRSAPAEELALRLERAEALPEYDPRRAGLVEAVRMAMAVRNRLDLQEQRERGMLAVMESAKELSSSLGLTGLPQAIAMRARNLLGSHLAWLTTIDPHSGEYRVVTTDGVISESTNQMTVGQNMGVISVVIATRMPFSTADYLNDNRFTHDPQLDDTFRKEGIMALVGVPLISNDQVLGLLFVADRYHRTHTALSIAILGTLATHAAVAISNAQAFEATNVALQNSEAARVELEHHARNVQSAAEAHEQLTSLLATGASLASLCQAIAQLMGGSVLVVDEVAQVISQARASGYSGKAADDYEPHGPHSAAIAQALSKSRQGGRSVVACNVNGELCRVNAVIGGNDVLGAVLLFRPDDLDEIAIRTFERCSSVIGIVLLSQERVEASKHRDVASLLRSLVSPRHDEPALTQDRASRFGLDLSQPLSLIVIEMDQPIKASFVARRLRVGSPLSDLVFDEVDGVLVIVCGTTSAHDVVQRFTALAKREFGDGFRGVQSRPIKQAAEVLNLYATLRRALTVLLRIGVQGEIVGQDQMALYSVLFETHDKASLNTFLEGCIGALVAHDQRRGAELTTTLLSYFDNNQNAKTTAQELGIHVNTVRQRLANVEELLGHWGSATRALEIHVALRLWSLTAKG